MASGPESESDLRFDRLRLVIDALSQRSSVEGVAELAVEVGAVSLGAVSGVAYIGGLDQGFSLAASRGVPESLRQSRAALPLDRSLPLSVAILDGRELWIPTHAQLVREFPSLARSSVPKRELASIVALPLSNAGQTVGGLAFSCDHEHEFSTQERDFLRTLASLCGLALERQQLIAAERKARAEVESERTRLRRVFMEAPAYISLLRGPELVYELSNPLNDAALGRPLLGKRLREAVPEFVQQGIVAIFERIYQTGEPYHFNEIPAQLRQPDGTFREVFLTGVEQATHDVDGNIDGVANFAFDVTEHVLARRNLQRASAALEQAIAVRDTFLSVASHELKTPLTPLSLRLQAVGAAAAAQPDSPFVRKVQRYVETADKQLLRLTALVDDLLDVSRIMAGRLHLRHEDVELAAIVEDVASRYEPQAAQAGSRLELQLQPVVGQWDALRLEQVVTNLLENAMKYGAGKPIRVTLSSDGVDARLVVADQGIGIAAEHLPRIFQRFERAVSDRNYAGLGLGLYITKTISEALGGSVHVESEPGRGATFTVVLPLRFSDPAPASSTPAGAGG